MALMAQLQTNPRASLRRVSSTAAEDIAAARGSSASIGGEGADSTA
tara:strand:+ start:148 stop:285 length:138 start_codon:yes stop_codon:yes gene_type:complete